MGRAQVVLCPCSLATCGSRSVALQTQLRRLHRPPVHRRGGGERPGLPSCLAPAGGVGAPWRSGAASAPGGCGLKVDWDPERSRSAGSETPIATRSLRCSEKETRKEEGGCSDLNPSPKSHRTTPSPGLVQCWGGEGRGALGNSLRVLFSYWATQTSLFGRMDSGTSQSPQRPSLAAGKSGNPGVRSGGQGWGALPLWRLPSVREGQRSVSSSVKWVCRELAPPVLSLLYFILAQAGGLRGDWAFILGTPSLHGPDTTTSRRDHSLFCNMLAWVMRWSSDPRV